MTTNTVLHGLSPYSYWILLSLKVESESSCKTIFEYAHIQKMLSMSSRDVLLGIEELVEQGWIAIRLGKVQREYGGFTRGTKSKFIVLQDNRFVDRGNIVVTKELTYIVNSVNQKKIVIPIRNAAMSAFFLGQKFPTFYPIKWLEKEFGSRLFLQKNLFPQLNESFSPLIEIVTESPHENSKIIGLAVSNVRFCYKHKYLHAGGPTYFKSDIVDINEISRKGKIEVKIAHSKKVKNRIKRNRFDLTLTPLDFTNRLLNIAHNEFCGVHSFSSSDDEVHVNKIVFLTNKLESICKDQTYSAFIVSSSNEITPIEIRKALRELKLRPLNKVSDNLKVKLAKLFNEENVNRLTKRDIDPKRVMNMANILAQMLKIGTTLTNQNMVYRALIIEFIEARLKYYKLRYPDLIVGRLPKFKVLPFDELPRDQPIQAICDIYHYFPFKHAICCVPLTAE